MFLVVALRWPEAIESVISTVAPLLDLSAYEARTRLAGAPPRILAAFADEVAARHLASALAAHGIAAELLADSALERDASRDIACSLELGADSLEARLPKGVRRVGYESIATLIQGVRTSTVCTVRTEKVKKLSPGRAMLTGGLVVSKTEVRTTTQSAENSEAFLYLRAIEGGPSSPSMKAS